jgi:hypothetical protein
MMIVVFRLQANVSVGELRIRRGLRLPDSPGAVDGLHGR